MTSPSRPRLLLLGAGEDAERWAEALGEHSDVVRQRDVQWAGIDAVVLTRGALDPFSRAREALLAGRPVLYAAPFHLSPWQAGILSELSRSRKVMLRFAELGETPAVSFLRRMLAGKEPLWQPLYIRVLRLAGAGSIRIDELAIEELALCDAALDGAPENVEATAALGHDSTEVLAIFITAHYANGAVVQCTVSLAEGRFEHSLIAATGGRTLVLDSIDSAASIRIAALAPNEHPTIVHDGDRWCGAIDPVRSDAPRFVRAIAHTEAIESNAERWARIAATWWAVRQSMSFGGRVELPKGVGLQLGPPPLHVIKGGGKTSRADRRPALTLVAS